MAVLSEKHLRLIKTGIWVAAILFLVVIFFTKLFKYVAPFIIALLITSLIEKPVRFLQNKSKISRGLAVGIVLILFIFMLGWIIGFAFYRMTVELVKLTGEMPDIHYMGDYIQSALNNIYLNVPPEIIKTIQDNLGTIAGTISGWLQTLLKYMLNFAKSLPQIFVFIIITIVAAFFMSRDREKISKFLYNQFPGIWADRMGTLKSDLTSAFAGFIKAQLTLIFITFIELLIGYTILNVKYAFSFAALTAVIDALPILGTGTVLIPAGIIYFLMGNAFRGAGFLVLYLIISVIRQSIEPRIVGTNLGLHPLVTLIAMYIGMQAFGIVGLFLGPIVLIILRALQKAHILPQWKA